MYNHIDDVKDKLESGNGIGSLPCTKYMLNAIGKMEKVLRKYHSKTVLPTVYGDGMILNPRCKLVLFEEGLGRRGMRKGIRQHADVDLFLSTRTTSGSPILHQ